MDALWSVKTILIEHDILFIKKKIWDKKLRTLSYLSWLVVQIFLIVSFKGIYAALVPLGWNFSYFLFFLFLFCEHWPFNGAVFSIFDHLVALVGEHSSDAIVRVNDLPWCTHWFLLMQKSSPTIPGHQKHSYFISLASDDCRNRHSILLFCSLSADDCRNRHGILLFCSLCFTCS